MKKLYFLLFTLMFTVASSFGQVVINEIDVDTPGSDTEEFVELKAAPNTSLDGYIVVFFNGSNDLSYGTWDLTGKTTDANGFFILANTSLVSGSDIELPPGGSGYVQNGPDAIAIYQDSAANFPDGTGVTTTNLIDVIVYSTNDSDDIELLSGFGETVQWDESANGANATESLQLNAAGTAYETKAPTFRASNDTAVCELSLTATSATCDAFTTGTDTYTATVDFTGGGTSTYTVASDSGVVDLTAGDPSTDAAGTITVTGIAEGTDVIISVVDGALCDLSSTVVSPVCEPTNTLPLTDDFTYADGSLVPNGGWSNHSGNAGDLLIASGQAVVQHGAPSEDANIQFTPVSGVVYYAFDFSVDDLGAPYSNAGTDYEYFAHFMQGTSGFSARFDIVPPSGAGDFTVGIASDESTADATWATDLTYDTTYRAIVGYNQDTNIAQLWIDATVQGDTSILGEDRADPGTSVDAFALRQSDSDENETIRVDNLVISQNFSDVTLSTNQFDNNKFSLYPNPTNSGFVNIISSNNEVMNVQVFDILGKQVKNEVLSNNTLNVSDLNSGIYIVKITQNNASITKKLVIK
ncbi:T9SS type A sorting domain-containing protein [Winogradskyella echinorum]|uniref:T9SS type A sorting domain-containing protein n=1 Tax=Winogradskyella echinorum TaxID=538189 RepID=A0ABR6XZM6_9FLAO|nr:T9SS type A sorting domain-containing protein [Winogradskyella echinorum]MBC3845433.1 T9SS type A sorting domain-containing protein [Winogradskyella echinorum]MBC5749781.1 T9SS type A sorting domain-containing protein [Winogradskyella echinorum]